MVKWHCFHVKEKYIENMVDMGRMLSNRHSDKTDSHDTKKTLWVPYFLCLKIVPHVPYLLSCRNRCFLVMATQLNSTHSVKFLKLNGNSGCLINPLVTWKPWDSVIQTGGLSLIWRKIKSSPNSWFFGSDLKNSLIANWLLNLKFDLRDGNQAVLVRWVLSDSRVQGWGYGFSAKGIWKWPHLQDIQNYHKWAYST